MDNTPSSGTSVSSLVTEQLVGSKPWVRFIAVIMFIGAALMLLAAIGMLIMGLIGGAMLGMEEGTSAGLMLTAMALVYGLCSFIYIYPALKLWKYANAIGQLIQSGSEPDLISALNEQRAFWKFVGIMMIVMVGIYALAIFLVMIGGIIGAAMSS